MQLKTARKILCNETFAAELAINKGVEIKSIKRKATNFIRDMRKKERKNVKENRLLG